MIDITTENLMPLAKAARHRAIAAKSSTGKPVNFSTVWRWTARGIRGVKLETVRVGGTRLTSDEAIERFISRLSGEPVEVTSPGQRRRAHDAAERELDRAGV